MSNNTPDYKDNLAFDPDANTMPRCDIEELKGKIKHLEDLQANQDKEVESLRDLLKECSVCLGYADVMSHSQENKEIIRKLIEKIKDIIG